MQYLKRVSERDNKPERRKIKFNEKKKTEIDNKKNISIKTDDSKDHHSILRKNKRQINTDSSLNKDNYTKIEKKVETRVETRIETNKDEEVIPKINKTESKIFNIAYLKYIESMKINDTDADIKNTISVNYYGMTTIQIKFKEKLTSLERLFFQCNDLDEIDLKNLYTDSVRSTADMFNGCYKLKTVNFGDFDSENIYNISNMFKNCSSLEDVNLDIFVGDKLKDIYGLFDNCAKLTRINFRDFNTIP